MSGITGLELKLTNEAIRKVKDFYDKMPEAKGKPLRIFISGGGCSGFQYGFTFDDARETDLKNNYGGIEVIVDPNSAPLLNGVTVDYVEDMRGAGFSVSDPNARSSCGCGKSFC